MMQSKNQNPPWGHHFIPKFLLDEWAKSGVLLRYYRDWRGDVQCEPRWPKGVCFAPDLYKIEGFPREHAQQMETIFMQWIDNAEANVHARLLRGEVDALSHTRSFDASYYRFQLRRLQSHGEMRSDPLTVERKNGKVESSAPGPRDRDA